MREVLVNILLILPILIGFGVLIFVHELGHFLAAKWAGIRTEGFAVGMGPVAVSWRKGVGLAAGSTDGKVRARFGKSAAEMSDAELEQNGLGETEYSLRWLPLGGFVKMLGQDDVNPTAVSNDPRSYQSCAIGKRMVVVSAGVVMNVLLALVLFTIAFSVGVKVDGPVVGGVLPDGPAARAVATNADALGIAEPGLQPGDEIVMLDGKDVHSFSDVQIGAAMAKPGDILGLSVRRLGFDEPLQFKVEPEDGAELMTIGVFPDRAVTLHAGSAAGSVAEGLDTIGLGRQGVTPGMTLVAVDGRPVTSYGAFVERVARAKQRTLETTWRGADGATVTAMLESRIGWDDARAAKDSVGGWAVLGLTPLLRIEGVPGVNKDRLAIGDVIVKVGTTPYPGYADIQAAGREHAGDEVDVVVLRDGERVSVRVDVSRKGLFGLNLRPYEDAPMIATTIPERRLDDDTLAVTPAAGINLMPGTRILAVNGIETEDWTAVRAALYDATTPAAEAGAGGLVKLRVVSPLDGADARDVSLPIDAAAVNRLHDVAWASDLDVTFFPPYYAQLTANGNPLVAMQMGVRETVKMTVLTYLTIDRLFRGSVKVNQLRGPVGIIHIGTQVLPQGFMYFLMLLGVISVNLAVINFLPLPIVDGGLFLYLVYEKLKGRPPSVGFQNAATLVGLALIGTIFLVTFYNDIGRLIGGVG